MNASWNTAGHGMRERTWTMSSTSGGCGEDEEGKLLASSGQLLITYLQLLGLGATCNTVMSWCSITPSPAVYAAAIEETYCSLAGGSSYAASYVDYPRAQIILAPLTSHTARAHCELRVGKILIATILTYTDRAHTHEARECLDKRATITVQLSTVCMCTSTSTRASTGI